MDTRVIMVDGQYSAFLSILFQAKHGSRQRAVVNPFAPNLHVALSVLCCDGVLHVHPCSSEESEHQIAAINKGIGPHSKSSVLAIVSDNPLVVDVPSVRQEFDGLQCVMKDPLHIAIKAEMAFGEKIVRVTALIRRCVVKFKVPHDDGQPFFEKGKEGCGPSTLLAVKAGMGERRAKRRIADIDQDCYCDSPYTNPIDFVTDLAAIAVVHPTQARRPIKVGKHKTTKPITTVLDSLVFATKAESLGYLFNHTRFRARFNEVGGFYGTIANDGFHNQFKPYSRNIFIQTGRNATLVCNVVTLAKVLVAKLRKDLESGDRLSGKRVAEHELL